MTTPITQAMKISVIQNVAQVNWKYIAESSLPRSQRDAIFAQLAHGQCREGADLGGHLLADGGGVDEPRALHQVEEDLPVGPALPRRRDRPADRLGQPRVVDERP